VTTELEKHYAVDALIDEAIDLRLSDFNAVITKGTQALTLARAQDYPRGMVRALNAIAWGYNRKGQYAQAADPAVEALEMARSYQFPVAEGYALCNIALCYSIGGQPDKAMEALLQQLQIGESHSHAELIHMALNDIGSLYLRQGELDDALRSLRRSLAVLEDNEVDLPKTIAQVNIASVYFQQGDYAVAEDLVKQVLDVEDDHGFVEVRSVALTILVDICMVRGDIEQAKKMCEWGLRLAAKHETNPIQFLMQLGRIYELRGDYPAAVAYYGRALTYAETQVVSDSLPHIYGALSDVLEQMGDLQAALDYSHKKTAALENMLMNRAETQAQVLRTLHGVAELQQELELREQNEQLQLAEARLRIERDVSSVKRRVLERISHEFRTPLSVLRTSMSLILRYGDRLADAQRQKHESKINAHFDHITRLLDDILSVLRAMDEHAEITPLPVDMVELCADAVARSGEADRVTFVPDDPTLKAIIDETYAYDIVTHLLTNALKYSSVQVELSLEKRDDNILLTIRDYGIGILPDEQRMVFEPLARGSNINEIPGIGLGLSIVKNDVRLLGGDIALDSTPGEGTTVRVTLPVIAPDADKTG